LGRLGLLLAVEDQIQSLVRLDPLQHSEALDRINRHPSLPMLLLEIWFWHSYKGICKTIRQL
jgi:hypothetical protein